MSFMNQALKGVPQDHSRRLLKACQNVTQNDVLEAMRTYLLPIFDPETSVAFVVCAPGKVDEISAVRIVIDHNSTSLNLPMQSLNHTGFEVERRSLDVGDADKLSGSESGSDSGSSL